MTTPRNPLLPAGYTATTVPGLVRAIRDIYAGVATREAVAAPTIRFGRRGGRIDGGPNTIAIVPARGPWGDPVQMGGGAIRAVSLLVRAHIWAPEPTIGADDLENELLRYDQADPMLARFLNVLARVAPGRIEPVDVDPDADQKEAAAANHHGETYVVAFRFRMDIPRDATVFAVQPNLDAYNRPTPQLSPAPYDVPPGTPASTITTTVSTTIQEPS